MVKLNIKYRHVPTYLVGLQDQVEKLIKLIDFDSEGVKVIVIHGMGGMGKTTLAKVAYNQLYSNYEGCSFLDNVREITKRHGLLHVQKKLLYDILNHDFAKDARDINDGINMIRGRLCHKKTLIVFDDVDDVSQFKNLAGKSGWFGSGSRIIITTRDRSALMMEGEVHKPYYHEVKQLPFDDALCLLCWHAFGKDYPPHDYKDISRDIVSTTGGLPLALEVVGSLLSCKCVESCVCMEIWKDTLNELRRVPNEKVEETLMISINKLDARKRKVFLDIACFLVNEDKTNAFYMWSACNISPHLVINFLTQMSLIKMGNNNRFQMHDQLRDLGREIVRREKFNNLGRPSRVWIDQEAEEIINKDQGTTQVEVLCLNSGNFTLTYDALANMQNLRFLKLQGGQFKTDFGDLFKGHTEKFLPNLKWLCWHHFPSNFTMKNFCSSNLVVLELCNSSITEHWEGWRRIKTASKLKVLDLTGCKRIKRTPDFSSFILLERLILQGCHALVEIDPSISKLKKLTCLNMEGCSVEVLPREIGVLASLTTITMHGRLRSFHLPSSLGNLTNLQSLVIRDVYITKLPESIGKLKNLNHLALNNCRNLKTLPDSIGNLKSLVELDISGSNDIIELPDSVGNLTSLKVINMRRSGIRRLPATIGQLKSLEEIYALECSKLEAEIPMEIGGLTSLKILALWNCRICGIPTSIAMLSHLKELHITFSKEYENTDLQWIHKLSKLEVLTIESSYVTTLKLPSGLRTLVARDLTFIVETSSSNGPSLAVAIPCLQELQMLRNMILSSCNFCDLDILYHLKNLRRLHVGKCHTRFLDLSNLRNLISLYLNECDGIVEIEGLGKLQLLQILRIRKCNSLEKLYGLSNLINLKMLIVIECEKLRGVRGLDKLMSLVVLTILSCVSLETFPDMSLFEGQLVLLSIDSPKLPRRERISNDNVSKDILNAIYMV